MSGRVFILRDVDELPVEVGFEDCDVIETTREDSKGLTREVSSMKLLDERLPEAEAIEVPVDDSSEAGDDRAHAFAQLLQRRNLLLDVTRVVSHMEKAHRLVCRVNVT